MIPLFKVLMDENVPDVVAKTIASGTITEGPLVLEFEAWLGAYLGSPVLTTNSGTSALHLAATLLDLAPGDEVISTPMTCVATNLALLHAGATIVWADVNPHNGLIDPNDVATKVTKRTRAVMAVDWGGALCAFGELNEAARAPVIEDAAHAFGAYRPLLQPWAICWSFQAIKHLTTGDGGALFVRFSVRDRARRLRWFGIDRLAPGAHIDKPIVDAGHKYHMNDLAASIGLANRNVAIAAVGSHRANAAWYGENLRDIPGVIVPAPNPDSAWWFYNLILENGKQQRFVEFMSTRGVDCSRVHARNDVHAVFRDARGGDLRGVDYFDSHQVAIPVGSWVGPDERERIADAVRVWSRT